MDTDLLLFAFFGAFSLSPFSLFCFFTLSLFHSSLLHLSRWSDFSPFPRVIRYTTPRAAITIVFATLRFSANCPGPGSPILPVRLSTTQSYSRPLTHTGFCIRGIGISLYLSRSTQTRCPKLTARSAACLYNSTLNGIPNRR